MYSKDEATNSNVDIADDDTFKLFEHKTKLVGSTEAANDILEKSAIAGLLKYLSNFWRSLEMPLLIAKSNWNLKYSVLSTGRVDNTEANPNSIFVTIKDIKLYIPVINLSAKDNHKPSKILSKGFERSVLLEWI